MLVKASCGNQAATSIMLVNEVTDFFTHWPSFPLLSMQVRSKQATGIPRPSKSAGETSSNQTTKPTEQKKKMNVRDLKCAVGGVALEKFNFTY